MALCRPISWLPRALAALCCGILLWPAAARGDAGPGAAPGKPGAAPSWPTGRKDGVGSAYGQASTVWYTLADGALSEVFYPTTDTPAAIGLSFTVTDGRSFADTGSLGMRSTVLHPDPRSAAYEVVGTGAHGGYRLIADYLADPARPVLHVHLHLLNAAGTAPAPYRVYLRYNPDLNANGAASTTDSASTDGRTLLAQDSSGHYGAAASALAGDPALQETMVGYAGAASDPARMAATYFGGARYTGAGPGNLVEGARVALRADGSADLGLGFGHSEGAAGAATSASLATPYASLAQTFAAGWHAYAARLRPLEGGFTGAQRDEYYAAAVALKASEDKRYPGAFVASLSVPWGTTKTADQGSGQGYHKVWARDLYEMASAFAAAGDLATARASARYMLHTLEGRDGSMPQNSLVDGTPVDSAIQMDEIAYPLVLARQLGLDDPATYRASIRPPADYLVRHGPLTQQERWEENGGYSPSTIAAEIAGLLSASASAAGAGDTARAAVYRAVADDWQRQVKAWTVTSTGTLAHHPYFIRLDDNLDPNDGAQLGVSNSGPYDERQVVDAGFLELVRLGELAPSDRAVSESLPVIDATLRETTPNGVGWHRYNHDTYGDRPDGGPWTGNSAGRGGLWPVFDGERGEYDLALGERAQAFALLDTMRRFAGPTGMIPEQIWNGPALPASPAGTDPRDAHGALAPGQAGESADPLNWSLAQYVRLAADLQAGSLLDRPELLQAHYVAHPSGTLMLTLSSPAADLANFSGHAVRVAGRTDVGATVVVMASGAVGGTAIPVKVDTHGRFSATIPVPSDYVVRLSIAARDAPGNTALVVRKIVS